MNSPSALSPKETGKTVRYAVAGAGWIAQEDFMPGVSHTGNSVITALVTGDAEKAKALSKRYGIAHACDYEGYAKLLRSGLIDAVYIALPNTMHYEFTMQALDARVHVLCEKPMAPTAEECQAMIDASEKSGAKLMIAYRLHFEEATIQALETVRTGTIGDPRIFSSVHTQQVKADNHRLDPTLWAGPLPDMGPYPINAARQLFHAEPVEAFAHASYGADSRFGAVPEMVSVHLRFPDEKVAQFVVSFGANSLSQYRVAGTEGDLEVVPGYSWTEPLVHRLTVGEKKSERNFKERDQFGGETKYFSACILEGRHPEPDGREGLADVRVINAIERSLQSGQPEPVKPEGERTDRPAPEQIEKLKPVAPGKMVHAAPAG